MRYSKSLKFFALMLAVFHLAGCSSTKVATDFSGLTSPDGTPAAHLSTSNAAIHLMMGREPVWGDATLQKTVADFTAAAKAHGASKVRIVQSSSRAWWFLFFPFTLFVTPVTSNVAGEAIQ
ncbi:MAG TPA: hypothetical protein VL688_01470 [Verrucomicrobiae bacterium]|jgi:hypothetical protein|nr:hypothetical protein [Verrucomicrobiae bacterium]